METTAAATSKAMLTESTSQSASWLSWLPGPLAAVLGYLILWWQHMAVFEDRISNRVKAIEAQCAANTRHRQGELAAVINHANEGDEARNSEFADLRSEFRAATAELRTITAAFTKASAEQNVINMITTKTLDAVTQKLETHAKQLAEMGATQALISELFKRMENRP